LEIPQFHSLILFIYNTVINFISVALKLLPLGQKEAQKIVCSLHKIMIKTAKEVMELSEEDIGAFAPAYEIRCMCHERLYSRLFMS
ncbi:urease accessory protein UreF, partial [Candidatus Aerophobetes bacterium]|nr:urease accessory protein UreF [Candidatus Aerophobetes bacterium]